MSRVKDLMIQYAEMKGITTDEIGPNVTLTDMQQALADRDGKPIALPVELGKTALLPPIPWLTIKSYVEVALKTVNLTDYRVEIKEQQGLVILWETYQVKISALLSNPKQQQSIVFQVKLFKTDFNPPLAIEFKREYRNVAIATSNFLSAFLIQRAIDQMEVEWAAESAAEDADARLLERGEAIAEEKAQLNREEAEWL